MLRPAVAGRQNLAPGAFTDKTVVVNFAADLEVVPFERFAWPNEAVCIPGAEVCLNVHGPLKHWANPRIASALMVVDLEEDLSDSGWWRSGRPPRKGGAAGPTHCDPLHRW